MGNKSTRPKQEANEMRQYLAEQLGIPCKLVRHMGELPRNSIAPGYAKLCDCTPLMWRSPFLLRYQFDVRRRKDLYAVLHGKCPGCGCVYVGEALKEAASLSPQQRMSDELRQQFYDETELGEHPAFEPYFALEDDELIMDGRFTLEHLKRIVAAWERYSEATKEAQP